MYICRVLFLCMRCVTMCGYVSLCMTMYAGTGERFRLSWSQFGGDDCFGDLGDMLFDEFDGYSHECGFIIPLYVSISIYPYYARSIYTCVYIYMCVCVTYMYMHIPHL